MSLEQFILELIEFALIQCAKALIWIRLPWPAIAILKVVKRLQRSLRMYCD